MPNGPLKITGLTFDEENVESEYQVEDEDLKVLFTKFLAIQKNSLHYVQLSHFELKHSLSIPVYPFVLTESPLSVCIKEGC